MSIIAMGLFHLGKMMSTEPQQLPPPDVPTISTVGAGRRLGSYTSQMIRWVDSGLIKGGCYRMPGRPNLIWWVDEADLSRLINEGGKWAGIKKRKALQEERRKRGERVRYRSHDQDTDGAS